MKVKLHKYERDTRGSLIRLVVSNKDEINSKPSLYNESNLLLRCRTFPVYLKSLIYLEKHACLFCF